MGFKSATLALTGWKGYRQPMLRIGYLLLCFVAITATASSAFGNADNQRGLKVGQTGPEIQLKDQTNTSRLLSKLVQKKHYTALVFYRSADW